MDRSSKEMWKSYLVVCRKRFKQQGQVFIEPDEMGPEDIADEPEESSDTHEDLEARDGLMVLSKAQFSQALHRLKQKPYGEILESPQRGWYRFRLSMMRGYCRLMAARQGIGVGLRYLDTHNRLVDIEEAHR